MTEPKPTDEALNMSEWPHDARIQYKPNPRPRHNLVSPADPLRAILGPAAVAAILAGEAAVVPLEVSAVKYGLDPAMTMNLTEIIYRGDKHLHPTMRSLIDDMRLDKPEQGHE